MTFIFWRLLLWVSPSALFYLLGTLQGVLKSAEWSRSLKIPHFLYFSWCFGIFFTIEHFFSCLNLAQILLFEFWGWPLWIQLSQEFLHQFLCPSFCKFLDFSETPPTFWICIVFKDVMVMDKNHKNYKSEIMPIGYYPEIWYFFEEEIFLCFNTSELYPKVRPTC